MQGEERDYKQIKTYGKLGDFAEKLKEEERKMLLLHQQQQKAFPTKNLSELRVLNLEVWVRYPSNISAKRV